MPTYLGKEVFLTKPNWATQPQEEVENRYDLFQSLGVAIKYAQQEESVLRFKASWLLGSREDIWDLLSFFDGRMGRVGGFWMPSWTKDVVITAAFDAVDTELTIQDIEYPTFWRVNRATGRHLYIEWPDGTYKLVGIGEAPDSTTLQLSSAVGASCSIDELAGLFVCFLLFIRFNQDEIELNYHTSNIAEVQLSFQTIGLEAKTVTTSSTTTTTSSSSSTSTTETS